MTQGHFSWVCCVAIEVASSSSQQPITVARWSENSAKQRNESTIIGVFSILAMLCPQCTFGKRNKNKWKSIQRQKNTQSLESNKNLHSRLLLTQLSPMNRDRMRRKVVFSTREGILPSAKTRRRWACLRKFQEQITGFSCWRWSV